MYGIKHAAQKRHRHDDEVLESRHLVKLISPQARDQTERTKHECTQHRKGDDPQRLRRHEREIEHRRLPHKQHARQQHTRAHQQAAHHGRQCIGKEPAPVRQRREQQEHQVAHDLALHHGRGAVGKRVLQHAHHHEARNQKRGVAHPVVHLHMLFEHVTKNHQVHHRSEHRCSHGLETDFPKAQHLFVKEHGPAGHHACAPVSSLLCITSRNTSSKSALRISTSCACKPASRTAAR